MLPGCGNDEMRRDDVCNNKNLSGERRGKAVMMLTDTTHSSFSHFPPRTALVAAQSALYALYANILPLRKASGEFFTFALGEQTLELKLTSISKKKSKRFLANANSRKNPIVACKSSRVSLVDQGSRKQK
jgi:hypothetical protein